MQTWKPHPGPQTKALKSNAYETLYGGARGGGKTDAGLIWLIKPYLLNNKRARSLVIRKNADDLSDWLDRATFFYQRYGVKVAGKPATLRFPSGYKIKTGHLKDDNAYTKYQGHEYQRILIEELTQIPTEKQYVQLMGSCRSTVDGLDARMFCTTNPGGIGHGWVLDRFKIEHMELHNTKFLGRDTERTRVFIPAKIEDNPTLIVKDPGYVKYLEGLKYTDEDLYKAWRLGRWDVFAGQFFKEFNIAKHVIRPFNPKWLDPKYTFVGGMDWGRADPFAMLLSLVFKVELPGLKPFYRSITFKEFYGTDKSPADWTKEILEGLPQLRKAGKVVSVLERFQFIQCDTQIFNTGNDNSVSIKDQFADAYSTFQWLLKPASKERIGGWENLHNWLSIAPDGLPYWLITEDCYNLIRTLPKLVHDDINKEDVNSEGEDHAPDAIRYEKKALKWINARTGAVSQRRLTRIKPTVRSALPMVDPAKMGGVNVKGGWGPA